MKKLILAAPLLLVAACGDEPAPETGDADVGGELSGDVLEGTISDEMLPLDRVTSTSPPAERTTTTTTTTTGGDGETNVETVTETVTEAGSGEPSAPAPAPPETPATPE